MNKNRLLKDKKGIFIFIAILAFLAILLCGLGYKVSRDLKYPFIHHLHLEGDQIATSDFTYAVEISKHWVNDPDTPLRNYGAQYDTTITNNSGYDIVKWNLVMEVPERNITIDSSWNGVWEYDKNADKIYYEPDDVTKTILAGDSVTFGAVMISGELMKFTDISITGCKYKPMTRYPLFWLIMILLIAWVTAFVLYLIYHAREVNHRRYADRLNNVISQTMSTFANFIDTKDRYTKGHSARVSYYSQKIAEKLGMSEEKVRDIGYIGLMHDCGKLSIPGEILRKPGKLTPEEFDVMKSHTTNGGKLLEDFTAIDEIRDGVLYHHERYDGNGYMEGLSGEDIPLVARIICVADALDAMNSDRCYREHLSREVILKELESNKGTQFDPKIAQIMIDMIKSGEVFVGGE